jgi:hypothetical protein
VSDKHTSFWIGRALVGLHFANDGAWDWTMANGDKHRDYMKAGWVRRPGEPPLFCIGVGPFMVLVAMRQKGGGT